MSPSDRKHTASDVSAGPNLRGPRTASCPLSRSINGRAIAISGFMATIVTGSVGWGLLADAPAFEAVFDTVPANMDLIALALSTFAVMAIILAWSARMKVGLRTAVCTSALMLVVLIGGAWLVTVKGQTAVRGLQRSLEGIAPTYAAEMRAHGHDKLASDAPADDPLYLELINAQKRWLAANPSVADVYTFRRDMAGQWRLIVDSETDYDRNGKFEGDREQRTLIGEPYDQAQEELAAALAGQRVFMDEPETDRWGTWVSAFVPMYDESGEIEGVLGVDFPASAWRYEIASARIGVIAYVAVILTIIAAASMLLIGYRRHMNEMARTGQILREQAAVLDRQNSDLEQRTIELDAAKCAADEANRSKSMFLANMSHEIRTPMAAILGYAELLRESDLGETERQHYLSVIRRNGDHLVELINEILDLSKIEAGKLSINRAPFRLDSVIAEIESTMRVRAADKGLDLSVEYRDAVPIAVESDAFRLRQILVNLLGNAIKFTDRGSVKLVARSESDPLRGQLIAIDVIDTGVGLSAEQVSQLFKPFSQVDPSTTRRHGGTGLGLVISRRLADLLGGDLTVRSEPGRGSVFTLTFVAGRPGDPVCAEPATEKTEPVASLSLQLNGRILLAEDGADNQRLLKTILGRAGAQVQIVGNGRLAVETAQAARDSAQPFDLILMDMQMPELDGYDATCQLRAAGFTLPIIALTAHAMDTDRARCIRAGCDDYATKPIDRAQLIRLCGRWMAECRRAA